MQRKRYNWLFIIEDWNLKKEFYHYKKLHPKIKSEKRLARSFVKYKKLPLWSGYELGHEPVTFHIVKCNWID